MMDKTEIMLKEHGFNCTKMQVAVLDVLKDAKSPLTCLEILEALRGLGPDKATIYRVLERFCVRGLVHKAYIDNRARSYELADKCCSQVSHPHFKCTMCGKVTCLTGIDVPLVEGLGAGYVLKTQKTMIEGVGPECRSKINREI